MHPLPHHVGKYTSDACVYGYPYAANSNKTYVNVELIEFLGEARVLALCHLHSNRLAWCYCSFLQWHQGLPLAAVSLAQINSHATRRAPTGMSSDTGCNQHML
jgi:hypothetical protein